MEGEASVMTFNPKAESVRDVQFDPFNPSLFAAAFENGAVQVSAELALVRAVVVLLSCMFSALKKAQARL